ncbi:MAG TPA: RNA methyltransferase [Frankiaceae bacterium]|nr:RNA methyltransferase [Frankiaceae bacterium]
MSSALATTGLAELFVTAEAAVRHPAIAEHATAEVSDEVMAALSGTVTPQGVVGVAELLHVPLATVLASSPRLVAVLAYARDPGNAGTILRTADAAGADAVVFPDDSVDPYNPKCVRSSAGSLFHLPVVEGGDVAETVAALRDAGLRVLATTADAGTLVDDADLSGPVAWLFGNEAWGLPDEVVALADERVRVPIHGRAESLNLSSAAAVCLYASARGQREPGGCRS